VGAGHLLGGGCGDRAVWRLHPQARLLRSADRARRGQRPDRTPGAAALRTVLRCGDRVRSAGWEGARRPGAHLGAPIAKTEGIATLRDTFGAFRAHAPNSPRVRASNVPYIPR